MTVALPEGTALFGRRTVWVVKTLANPASPQITELNDPANAVKATCYVLDNAGGMVTGEQGTVDANRRLCETVTRQKLGAVTRSVSPLLFTINAQGDAADAANRLRTFITPGEDFYLVNRYGLPDATAVAAAQRVEVVHVTAGVQNYEVVGDGESSELGVRQAFGMAEDGFYEPDVALVA